MSTRCKKCDFPFPDHETRDGLCISCAWVEIMDLRKQVADLTERIKQLQDPTWGEEPNK